MKVRISKTMFVLFSITKEHVVKLKCYQIMRKIVLYTIGAILLISASSCADSTTNKSEETSKSSIQISVSGKICDENGNALNGATVSSGDNQATTDSSGIFNIYVDTPIGNRCVLRIQNEGYFDRIYSKMVDDTMNYPIHLIKKEPSEFVTFKKFKSEEGTTVMVDGASVSIPKSGLVNNDGSDYNGMVNISVVYLSPSKNMDPLMPGSDLMALASNGDTTPLISYGMINVEMTDETGNELQLKSGCEAVLKYPAPNKLTAHDTIPLWYFNEENGLWIEEGYSVKKGNEYIGSVKHFTWWNCDIKIKNGAIFRCRLINYPYEHINIFAAPDTIFTWINGNMIQTNIFPNRPFSILGKSMPALKPNQILDTVIVFHKILFRDINGKALSLVKFKLNDVLNCSYSDGSFTFPTGTIEKEGNLAIRFQHYDPVTITVADFDSDGKCIVTCKPIEGKAAKQTEATSKQENDPKDEWDDSKIELSRDDYPNGIEAFLVFPSDSSRGPIVKEKKEKILSAQSISSRLTFSSKKRKVTPMDTLKYVTLSFKMSFYNPQTDKPVVLYSDSEEITEQMKEEIKKSNNETIIYVYKTKVLGADGLKRILPPIEIHLE